MKLEVFVPPAESTGGFVRFDITIYGLKVQESVALKDVLLTLKAKVGEYNKGALAVFVPGTITLGQLNVAIRSKATLNNHELAIDPELGVDNGDSSFNSLLEAAQKKAATESNPPSKPTTSAPKARM